MNVKEIHALISHLYMSIVTVPYIMASLIYEVDMIDMLYLQRTNCPVTCYIVQVYVISATYQFTPPCISDVNVDLDGKFAFPETYNVQVSSVVKKFDRTDYDDVSKIITNK